MSYRKNRQTGGTFRTGLPYSFRDYVIGDYALRYVMAGRRGDDEAQRRVREEFKHLESGRIHRIAEDTHILLAALDPDELELFKSRNPELVRITNEYAVVEDLREF